MTEALTGRFRSILPFTLAAIGGDPNPADLPNLTYTWEQVDPGKLNGGATDYPNPPYQDQPGDPSTTTRPILRALEISTDPARTFPQLTYILNNTNDPPDQVGGLFTAEELPRVGRTLNFRVTVRDNRAGAGGTATDLVTLTVNGASGPFQVTAPNGGGSWTVGSSQSVTWNVNNTNNAPVSCASVKISLSTDGGLTFPHVLAASTANDGAETITVPTGLSTSFARVKVEAVGNVFFDLSNGDFTINAGAGCPFVTSVLPGAGNSGDGGDALGYRLHRRDGGQVPQQHRRGLQRGERRDDQRDGPSGRGHRANPPVKRPRARTCRRRPSRSARIRSRPRWWTTAGGRRSSVQVARRSISSTV